MEAAATTGELPQHMRALQRANVVRLARAERKREIGRGDLTVTDAIRECPMELETIPLAELLTSQRRWGRTRARKLLQSIALAENKKLGSCTPRQRALLCVSLESKGAGKW
jgi:hypothetical protein